MDPRLKLGPSVEDRSLAPPLPKPQELWQHSIYVPRICIYKNVCLCVYVHIYIICVYVYIYSTYS